jgi:cerevisin
MSVFKAQAVMSGTSMATPHVAGLVAYLIAKEGNISPAAMETKVRNLSAVGYITDLRKSYLIAIFVDID